MNLAKTIRNFKNNNITAQKSEPTYGNLYVEDNAVYLDIDGTFFSIEIYYTGTVYIDALKAIGIKTQLNRGKITITNLIAKEIPRTLFEYSGNMTVSGCSVLTQQGKKIKASITSPNLEDRIDKQKTNLEDADLILYYTEAISRARTGSLNASKGINTLRISPSAITAEGKLQRIDKVDMKPYLASMEKTQKVNTKTPVKSKKAVKPVVKYIKKPTKGGY